MALVNQSAADNKGIDVEGYHDGEEIHCDDEGKRPLVTE